LLDEHAHPAHESERGAYCMRVLVSAYACEPGKGSEPGVGWNWVKVLSVKNEIWVLTRENNKASIERELLECPMPNVHFEYVDVPRWISFWKKGQRGVRTYYYLWQWFAAWKARQLNSQYRFDLGHHVSFVNDWIWTFLSLSSLPYVWGPVGSHPRIPWKLLEDRKSRLFDMGRFVFQCAARLADPLFWLSALRAKKIMFINKESLNLPPFGWLAKSKAIIEPAIGVEEDLQPGRFAEKKNVAFLFMGRFVQMKCPHIALDAFIEASKVNSDILLIMLGEGPMGSELKLKAQNCGISERVKFIAWLPRDEALSLMNQSDVFLFPSTEGGGMVVLEALALGKPVVCLDIGGPGEFVDQTCGIKVVVEDYRRVVHQLSLMLLKLSADNDLRRMLGQGARIRSHHFAWKNKGDLIDKIYGQIVSERPDLGGGT